MRTQSAGVLATRKAAAAPGHFCLRALKGAFKEMECPVALACTSGAEMATSPNARTDSKSTFKPGASIPSSFVRRIFIGVGYGKLSEATTVSADKFRFKEHF